MNVTSKNKYGNTHREAYIKRKNIFALSLLLISLICRKLISPKKDLNNKLPQTSIIYSAEITLKLIFKFKKELILYNRGLQSRFSLF